MNRAARSWAADLSPQLLQGSAQQRIKEHQLGLGAMATMPAIITTASAGLSWLLPPLNSSPDRYLRHPSLISTRPHNLSCCQIA